jgi:chemotaxis protein MotB
LARKKTHPEHGNSERWLVSYADLLTLLFAFFVVMFASSQTDKARAKAVSDSVSQALKTGGIPSAIHEILGGTVDEHGKGNGMMKGPGGFEKKSDAPASVAELVPSMQYLNKMLEAEISQGKIDVHFEPRGLVVSLRQSAFFPSGTDSMDPKTAPTIEKIAGAIRELPNPVRLEGHTDSVPIHTARFRSNWELSAARAIAVMDLLSARFGIPSQRLAIAGYAETAPVESNDTEEGRAHNRRVDLVILNQQALIKEPVAGGVGSVKADSAKPEAGGAVSSKHE